MATTTPLTEADLTRISSSAAEDFVDAYYTALNASRHHISSFYVPPSPLPNNRSLPHISYNGEPYSDAAAFQETFEKQMPWTHFEAQSVNVHVLNPCMVPLGEKAGKKDAERNMSLVVQVSGYVRLVERKEGPMRGFSDSFVLVPNKEEVGGRGTKGGEGRKWLVQSQNFRFVV